MAALNFLFGTAKKSGSSGDGEAVVMFDNTTAYAIRCHLSVKSTKASADVGAYRKGIVLLARVESSSIRNA